jgi:hypothetical protein
VNLSIPRINKTRDRKSANEYSGNAQLVPVPLARRDILRHFLDVTPDGRTITFDGTFGAGAVLALQRVIDSSSPALGPRPKVFIVRTAASTQPP